MRVRGLRLKSSNDDIRISSFPSESVAQNFKPLLALPSSRQRICSGAIAKPDDVFNGDQGRFRVKRRRLRLFGLRLSVLTFVLFTWYFRCSIRFIAIRTGGPGNPGLAGRIKA